MTDEELERFEVMGIDMESALFADGFNDCVIGGTSKGLVVYSTELILESLMKSNDDADTLDDDELLTEAIEHFEYNIAGSYMGEMTPIYVCSGTGLY